MNIKKRLHKIMKSLWEHTGSNRGPSRCKRDALNQLSYAPLIVWECKNKVCGLTAKKNYAFSDYSFKTLILFRQILHLHYVFCIFLHITQTLGSF